MSPKVFVSHASEDKERFVIKFAERLRSSGIDAWIDKWEMLPGDSLVDKIFDAGIKNASGVIVVISSFSINKPWVKEELNAAFVKRINTGSKLIPVVIDECSVPNVLHTTLWEKIKDLSSYDASFDRIVASIFGTTDKPALGPIPKYVNSLIHNINGLNKIDSFVLHQSCKKVMEIGQGFLEPEKLFALGTDNYLPEVELRESLEILDEKGYIKLLRHMGGGLFPYQISTWGFERYTRATIPDYEKVTIRVVSSLVNDGLTTNIDIQVKLNENIVLIDHILDILENQSLIKQVKALGGNSYVLNISPSLRRSLNNT